MNLPQTQQPSLLSAPRLRDNDALANFHTPPKRPRVQIPLAQQHNAKDTSFSFFAHHTTNVPHQHSVLSSSTATNPPAPSAAEQQPTNNPQSLRHPASDPEPVEPPLLNHFDALKSDIEIISLDEDDDLNESHTAEKQPSHQATVTADSQINPEPEVIDLDDDDALANLQPLPLTKTKMHVSRGGGLFRVQASGQLEIVDSDDEEELTRTHRLLSLEDGLHTVSSATQRVLQPVIPNVQEPPPSSTLDLKDDEQEKFSPTQGLAPTTGMQSEPYPLTNAIPPIANLQNETSQPSQTTAITTSFQFSDPVITRWSQSNMHPDLNPIPLVQQQNSDASSTDMFFQGFVAGAANEPLRDHLSAVHSPSPEQALSTIPTDPNTIAALTGSAWLNPHPPNALYPQQHLAHPQRFITPSSIAFPSTINPSALGVTPTQIIHHNVSLASGNQAHRGSLPTGDEGAMSAEGLRNLIKQNGLTADATEEAETPFELNVSLMPHQKRALHWMAKREVPVETDEEISVVDEQCLGGILADDQGLGKTLTMIALLLKNRPGREERAHKRECKPETDCKPEMETKPERDCEPKRENELATSDESIDLEKDSSGEDDDDIGLTSDDDDFVAPDPSDNAPWKTLIVCPLSVINQWKEELCSRIKADFAPRVCVYHGPKRERRVSALENCDVVITTYSTLVTEYPKILKDHPEFKKRKKEKLPLPKRSEGPICRVTWNRVVLDEAQHVKNRGTDSWSAVMSLKAEKRWCLTGTPIQNSVDDIYSLFCFIRYQFVPNYETWNARWKKRLEHSSAMIRERAFKRFQTIVGVVLLRRTKNDTIKGAPLITLPKRMAEVETPEFCDKEEEVVYRAVQEKSVLTFNKFLVAGTLANNYSSVLLVLLRLRQACSHPFLIEYAGMYKRGKSVSEDSGAVASEKYSTSYSAEDLEEAMELIAGGHSLLSMIDEAARPRVQAALMPPGKGMTPTTRIACQYCQRETPWPDGSFLACGDMFCPDCCQLLRKERKCLRCLFNIGDPNVTEVFINADELRKEVHAEAILAEDQVSEMNITASEFKSWFQLEVIKRRSSSSSNTTTPDTTDGEVDDSKEDDEDDALNHLEKSILEKKAKAANGRAGRSGSAQTEAKKERLLRALSQHSTKIRRILEKLNEIRERDSNEKTLIFSQWTSMLDIIEFHVQLEGHEVCRLDGSMTLSNRQKQIECFRASPTKNVFLISLHAGGTGLNLTAASNVIIADVWWNPAVEEQAIDRAHRIGQTKDVNVTRFKMKNTVEERIYAICAKKREAADGTLGVTGAQSLGRKKLSLQELMYIFGGAAQDVAQSAQRGSAAAEAANNILNYQHMAN